LALGADPLVTVLARAFAPEKRELTRRFVVVLAPFVVLDGIAGMFTAALYAKKRYANAILVSATPPLVTLLAVLCLSATWGVSALVLGALVGAGLEAILSGVLVRRMGMAVVPALSQPGPEDLGLLRGFGLLLVGGFLMSSNTVVDQTMAAGAGAGSVASLGYGAKIPAAFLGLAGAALGTVTLPHYASFVASRRFTELGANLRRHVLLLAAAGFAVAVPLALLSRPLVHLLFEHGSFLAADTLRVSQIQAMYALQIPGYVAGIAAARFLNAMGRDKWILAVSFVNFVLNVTGNWVLLRFIGVPGIALSTAIVYSVAATLLLILCRKAVRHEARLAQTA
jgi:putative peptidoglycan lipid II flippase